MSAQSRIMVDSMELDMEAIPGIDPGLFARHLEIELARLHLGDLEGAGHIASLDLPALTARPGETAVTLAKRVGAEIGRRLATATGGRP